MCGVLLLLYFVDQLLDTMSCLQGTKIIALMFTMFYVQWLKVFSFKTQVSNYKPQYLLLNILMSTVSLSILG